MPHRSLQSLKSLGSLFLFLLLALAPLAASEPQAAPTGPPPDPDSLSSYADILATWPEPVRLAAETLTDRDDERWAWTFRSTSDDETLVERWDPSKPDDERTWLLERNGKAATPEQARKHGRKRAKERAERKPQSEERRYERTRAWLETLRFAPLPASEGDPADAQGWIVTAVAPADNFESLPRSDRIRNRVLCAVTAKVWVSTGLKAGFVKLELENTGEIHPYFSVHIRTLRFAMELAQPDGSESPWLPTKLTGKIAGRFLLVGSLDEEFSVEFFDYAPVTPAAEPVAP